MKLSHNVMGALLSALAFLFFTCFDTLSKFVSRDYSVFQIMAIVFTIATLLMLGFVRLKYQTQYKSILKINRMKLHVARGVAQIVGQSCAYLALPHLSLAEFYVVVFMMPLMVVLISAHTLKEKIRPFVWGILALNFSGVLIALRPDEGMSGWTLLLFAGAFLLSGSLVLLRKMMETESSEMTGITTTIALAIGSIIPAFFMYQPMVLPMLGLCIVGGVLFAIAQLLITTAYRIAPTSYAGPPQFLQLVYGAITGYIVFGDVPSIWIYLGGGIVVIANLLLLMKQHHSGQNEHVKH